MNPQLKLQLDTVTETARTLLELHGALVPVAFIIGDKVQIIGCPFRTPAEKTATVQVLRERAREAKAHTFIFLSEIWHAEVDHWERQAGGGAARRKGSRRRLCGDAARRALERPGGHHARKRQGHVRAGEL